MFGTLKDDSFSLKNFEGPLDFLIYLVQKKEIDIYDVPIQELTQQYLQRLSNATKPELEIGAEFIGKASSLLLFKSKQLLPNRDESSSLEEEDIPDPNFEIIHHLLDYCQFKEAAKTLTHHEEKQQGIYHRGIDTPPNLQKTLGIEHLSLEDFSSFFQHVLENAEKQQRTVHEEEYRVSDKISLIKETLKQHDTILISLLLSPTMCRNELIVTFLALLELMKAGDIKIVRSSETNTIMVTI